MNRIDRVFEDLHAGGRKGLMPFVCGGHPRPGVLPALLQALERGGASIVEIGIPFSDPIADGPVIASAMHSALGQGVTPRSVFDEVRSVRDRVSLGLVAMVSVSIVYGMGGPEAFAASASEAGFDGFIFPDAPLEESDGLLQAARSAGLTASLLVAPTTGAERARAIATRCTGFVYLLARSGITGEREAAPDIAAQVRVIREATDLPIACGFGISTAEQVRAVVSEADAAIVGSALVRRLSEAEDPSGEAEAFAGELRRGLT
jgi:tryptophan synthase alpha chain